MPNVKDVPPDAFVREMALFLKRSGKIELPKWVDIVKTGSFKELSPYDPDWFYTRCAAIARRLYLHPGLGVIAFRRIFGGRNRHTSRPEHFRQGSGAVNRHAIHALESCKILERNPDGTRRVSREGQRHMDHIASQLARAHPVASLI